MITLPGGEKAFADSTGKRINIGDRLRFRGQEYTLKAFGGVDPHNDVQQLIFEEDVHTEEIPTEIEIPNPDQYPLNGCGSRSFSGGHTLACGPSS